MKTPYEVLTAFFNLVGNDADILRFEACVHNGTAYTYKITLDNMWTYYWNTNLEIWERDKWTTNKSSPQ